MPNGVCPVPSVGSGSSCCLVLPLSYLHGVQGTGRAAGAPLSESPLIDMVSFTGSVQTGSMIMGAAAKNIVKPLLELGGKSPSVIFDDVDLDTVLPWVMHGFLVCVQLRSND